MRGLLFCFILLTFSNVFGQWRKVTGFPANSAYTIKIIENVVWVGTYNSGMYRSTDNMRSWTQVNDGITQNPAYRIKDILSFNGNVFIATENGIYKLSVDGNSWIRKSNGITLGNGATYLFCESLYAIGNRLITGAYSGIYSSTDNGESWQVSNVTGTHIWAKNLTLFSGKLFAARESNNTPVGYISSDSGRTWTNFTGIQYPVITFFVDGDNLWAGTIHGAWLSTDLGVSWTRRSDGLSLDPYNSSFLMWHGILFSTLKFGGSSVSASVDYGMHWIDVGETDSLPFISEINEIFLHNDSLFLATSEGIFKRAISDFIATLQIQAGWNLVANPMITTSSSKADLFPFSNSPMFAYDNGYIPSDSLTRGKGYWLRFPENSQIKIFGIADTSKKTNLVPGWNIVSSRNFSGSTSAVSTSPAGILSSQFFGFTGSYTVPENLSKGKAYWVKSNTTGLLITP